MSCDFEFFIFQTKPFKKNVKKYIIQDNKFTSEKVKNEDRITMKFLNHYISSSESFYKRFFLAEYKFPLKKKEKKLTV